MIIRSCDSGHLYDAQYFRTCPHCQSQSTNIDKKEHRSDSPKKPAIFHENIQKKVEQSIDEVKEKTKKIAKKEPEKKDAKVSKPTKKAPVKQTDFKTVPLVAMASMPEKIAKNQEFCIDLCIFSALTWREGADMLSFKTKNGARDIKTIALPEDGEGKVKILYKDEVLNETVLKLCDLTNQILTLTTTITDTRDRRLHMIKLVLDFSSYGKSYELILQPVL